MATSPRPRAALETRVDVETPELVSVTYTIAGVGSRARASIIDHLLILLVVLVGFIGLAVVGLVRVAADALGPWSTAILLLALSLGYWGYFVVFEALWDGQTPGKRMTNLRVVREGGYSVTFGASAARNLLRLVDAQPGITYAVGVIAVTFSKQGKRLGDIVGGTLVVQEAIGRIPDASVARPVRPSTEAAMAAALHSALTDPEFALLDGFIQRHRELDETRRAAFVTQLSSRFAEPLRDVPGASPTARLIHLRDNERAARERGVSAKSDTGAARERHAIVAQGSARWSAFATALDSAQHHGLASLGEPRVRDFVRDYRELASDLARLRTATRGADASDVFFLNRLVAGAHNLLYRRRTLPLRDIARYCFAEVPAEIRRSSTPIALATFLMFAPMVITWVAVLREPTVAATLLPPAMLDRADDGVRRAQQGTGYIEDPELLRPVMATRIISNNIQVAFLAFASGITAGVLTLWVLVSNGISIGAVSGLYASKGIGSLLLSFVAPHGVLELSAIALSGAGGLLLGGAILIPGARTRRRALREEGVRSLRLVAAATMLLLVAGLIEGLVSPIPYWPLELKLAVSAMTAVLLYLFVRLGAPRSSAVQVAPSPSRRAGHATQMAPRDLRAR